MIIPDINLLVYAYDRGSPHHERARKWWEDQLNGSRMVGLPWAVILGLVRLLTNPRIFSNPYPPSEILAIVEVWVRLPHVQIIHPSDRHLDLLSKLIAELGTAGNLTTDAHLAALAIERGLVLCSSDTDFARFENLKWRNPLKDG